MSEQQESEKAISINVMDASGKPVKRYIPEAIHGDYLNVFGSGIPKAEDVDKWLTEREQATNVRTAFKIKPEVRQVIYNYLNGRPMSEVEPIIEAMFETKKLDEKGNVITHPDGSPVFVEDPFYTKEGIQMLTLYLRDKCPRSEAKPIINMLANNGIEQYSISKKEEVPVVPDKES